MNKITVKSGHEKCMVMTVAAVRLATVGKKGQNGMKNDEGQDLLDTLYYKMYYKIHATEDPVLQTSI